MAEVYNHVDGDKYRPMHKYDMEELMERVCDVSTIRDVFEWLVTSYPKLSREYIAELPKEDK